ncbi:hypothetical protein [Synoicihabitans lomoniglobus]|uniref:Uncharacterized protein n=1 Tax=Synoicihabitans lomoniglobus TaxID=2909285 RepID=A0AAF0CMM4_9BACT|nr:hypothetical protein [Opitutaceae bacterium LMO-M01]WED63486.1 hypothetical protein PXH66_14190 [Opitutaceae bacterium LMO-M01]
MNFPSSFPPAKTVLVVIFSVLLGASLRADDTTASATAANDEFMPDVQLAPFVVNGEPLAISIHARTKRDRRYAEDFAEEVIAVAHETLNGSTGRGLVIIGRQDEPHPIFVFRQFLAMAEANELDPAVAKSATELTRIMQDWRKKMNMDDEEKNEEDALELNMDNVITALPLPLEGVASKLYQIAWKENFEVDRIDQKLRVLTAADLADDQFSNFHWVYYLPPRNAFNQALKEILPAAMKKEKMGIFKRAALRSAIFVFKPAIKKAVEGMRKGMLFMTVMHARTDYSDEDIMALTGAYVEVLMPDFKFNGGTEHQRAVEAIEAQKIKNEEYARNPFITPDRLTTFDAATYSAFEGEYVLDSKKATHWFKRDGDTYTWTYQEDEPRTFHPAGERLLVKDDGKMTIEFQVDETGTVTGVEERWHRRRQMVAKLK